MHLEQFFSRLLHPTYAKGDPTEEACLICRQWIKRGVAYLSEFEPPRSNAPMEVVIPT